MSIPSQPMPGASHERVGWQSLQSSCAVVDDPSLSISTGATPSSDGQRRFGGGPGGASTLYQCGA